MGTPFLIIVIRVQVGVKFRENGVLLSAEPV
jgi:hypothetical protein